MMQVLRQKLIRLVRGEEGVALVVTLALFMFLYVSCAGVYTVGKAVQERIILQNAVDAAAYSAAVVQADYLSRIATINKAMAWNYVQFLKSQKSWIAVHFFKEVIAKSLTYNRPRLDLVRRGVIDVIRGNGSLDVLSASMPAEASSYANLDDRAADIEKYYLRILDQNNALQALKTRMRTDVINKANDILRANLPFRIGELCRKKIAVRDVLEEMGSQDDEERFLDMAEADADLSIFRDYPWFEFSGGAGVLNRDVLGTGKLRADWETSPDNKQWYGRSVDAKDEIADSVPYHGEGASPLKIVGKYFFADADGVVRSAGGAITVAVAKRNENPWKELLRDLTGIHAAFNYAERNDWTFAIASAQAAYHPSGSTDPREYSLDGDAFIGTSDNLRITDWDAVYLPVRKAFADEDEFKDELMDDGKWEKVVTDGEYVKESLEDVKFYELNHAALPRMHNNGGGDNILKWNGDGTHKFLDLMYH